MKRFWCFWKKNKPTSSEWWRWNTAPENRNHVPEDFLRQYNTVEAVFSTLPWSLAVKLLDEKSFLHVLLWTTPLTFIPWFTLSSTDYINHLLLPYSTVLYNWSQWIYVFNTLYYPDVSQRDTIVNIWIIPWQDIIAEEIERIQSDYPQDELLGNNSYNEQFEKRITRYPPYTRLRESILTKQQLIEQSVWVETTGLQELVFNRVDLQEDGKWIYTVIVCDGQRFFTSFGSNFTWARLDPSFDEIRKSPLIWQADTWNKLFSSFLPIFNYTLSEATYSFLTSLKPQDIILMKLNSITTYPANGLIEWTVKLITKHWNYTIPLPLALVISIAFDKKIYKHNNIQHNIVNEEFFSRKEYEINSRTLYTLEDKLLEAIEIEQFEQAVMIKKKLQEIISKMNKNELEKICRENKISKPLLCKIIADHIAAI